MKSLLYVCLLCLISVSQAGVNVCTTPGLEKIQEHLASSNAKRDPTDGIGGTGYTGDGDNEGIGGTGINFLDVILGYKENFSEDSSDTLHHQEQEGIGEAQGHARKQSGVQRKWRRVYPDLSHCKTMPDK